MRKLTKRQQEEIIKRIQENKIIPDKFRFMIPFETEREYELTYVGKERKEDILVNTLSVPFQPIKKFGSVKESKWQNMLIFGDNLQALKHLFKLKEQGKLRNSDGRNGMKLIYIDPPFGTGDIYDAAGSTAPAYSAKLKGPEFINSLRKRLLFLNELLTDDGSIYIRIDYHYGHYVKVISDEIFGKENFVNELIINRVSKKGFAAREAYKPKKYPVSTDSLFLYCKTNKYFFDPYKIFIKSEKERWHAMDVMEPNPSVKKPRIILGKEMLAPRGRKWMYSQENINKMEKEGLIKLNSKGKPIYKIKSQDFQMLDSNWTDIPGYTFQWGYPTENSEKLLERVIKTSSCEGDIVLDCYAGSGTTGAVAEKLLRKWIMCDASKLAIYTIQKRMLNLKTEISNKGRQLIPKPFILYNAGLYQDSGFIEKMEEADYKKFVLELFNAVLREHKIKGVKICGTLNNQPVMVFSQKDFLTYEFIDDLHRTVGGGLKDEMYIITPQSAVRFNEDYIDKGKIRYHILKVPYSIIQKILEKDFVRGFQPLSKANINQTIESVGFDFIYPPNVECEYYLSSEKSLFDNLVIKIKKFEPVQISKKPVEFENPKKEALSIVIIDEDYDGKIFDMDYYFFGDEIVKNDFKVVFPKKKSGKKIMIIYLDVLGNEKVEVKHMKDFKKK